MTIQRLIGSAANQVSTNGMLGNLAFQDAEYVSVGSLSVEDGGNINLSGRLISTAAGLASEPPVSLTGSWYSDGTSTTTKPQLLVEPSETVSDNWNTNGTGLGINAPDGFSGNLIDLKVNGTTVFKVDSSGSVGLGNGTNFIPFSALESLSDGNILIGSSTNIATSVTLSGDISLNNTGLVTVVSGSTTAAGKVKLSTATNSTSTELAATPSAVKSAYDLANNALPVSGGTMTGQIVLDEIKEKVYTLAANGTISLDPANGSIQSSILSGNPTFTDDFETGQTVVLMLENGSSYTVIWPTDTTWVTSAGNAAPTLTAKDTLVFWKVDTTLYGAYVGKYY